MRNTTLGLLLLGCLAFPVQAAQPNLSDISGTWSGLDKTTVAVQLSSVVLTIEVGSDQTVQGTLVSTVIPYNASSEAVTAMAIFHKSNQANQAPYILYRSDEVPASVLSLADLDPLSAAAQAARKESSQQQRSHEEIGREHAENLYRQVSVSERFITHR